MKITPKGTHPALPWLSVYMINGCVVLCGIESGKWHLSISHKTRYPTWDEIKRVRYELMPKDKTIAMILPPTEEYINVHKNCFHLWEIEK